MAQDGKRDVDSLQAKKNAARQEASLPGQALLDDVSRHEPLGMSDRMQSESAMKKALDSAAWECGEHKIKRALFKEGEPITPASIAAGVASCKVGELAR